MGKPHPEELLALSLANTQLLPGDTRDQGGLIPGSRRTSMSLELWGPLALTLLVRVCLDLQQGTLEETPGVAQYTLSKGSFVRQEKAGNTTEITQKWNC